MVKLVPALLTQSPMRQLLRASPLLHSLRQSLIFLFGLCLVLSIAHPAPAQAAREIAWQDLLPPKTEVAGKADADPFAAMPPEHLADLARVEYMRWWLENDGETRDGGAIDPEVQRQKLAKLEQKLTDQGYDVDFLLEQVEVERDRRLAQQDQTNSSLAGQSVQLPGFVLPLDQSDNKELQAFLLVPYVGACIHVPSPPPNQMVFVEAPKAVKNPGTFSAVKITGEIRPEPRTYELFRVDGRQPVDVGYSMVMTDMVKYQPKGENLLPSFDELSLPEDHTRWQNLQVWSSAVFGRTMSRIQDQRSLSSLAIGSLLAFAYGVLHTLGPGHGKAVIVSYFVGQGGSLRRGLTMGVRVAVFHVFSAVLIAVATDLIVRQALGSAPGSYTVVRLVSYGAISAIGFWMLQQATDTQPKSQVVTAAAGSASLSPSLGDAVLSGDQTPQLNQQLQHQSQGICSCIGCGDGKGGWLSLAIGAVPCSGALLVLIYGLANDLLWASLLMVLAISLGMAITLSGIGIVAIWGREQVGKRSRSDRKRQKRFRSLQLFSACAVLITGTFLFGLTLASALL